MSDQIRRWTRAGTGWRGRRIIVASGFHFINCREPLLAELPQCQTIAAQACRQPGQIAGRVQHKWLPEGDKGFVVIHTHGEPMTKYQVSRLDRVSPENLPGNRGIPQIPEILAELRSG